MRFLDAASASHAEKVVSSSATAALIASSTSGGTETEV
jgi:hypothetical protein